MAAIDAYIVVHFFEKKSPYSHLNKIAFVIVIRNMHYYVEPLEREKERTSPMIMEVFDFSGKLSSLCSRLLKSCHIVE